MEKIYALIIFFAFTFSGFSQDISEWKALEEVNYFQPGVSLIPWEHGFFYVAGNRAGAISYLAKAIEYTSTSVFPTQTFYGALTENGLFTLGKWVFDAESMSLVLFKADGSQYVMDPLPDDLGTLAVKAPAVLQLSSDEFAVFGRDYFRMLALQTDSTYSLVWEVPNDKGLCVDADYDVAGFILCTLDGTSSHLIRLDVSGNVLWSQIFAERQILAVEHFGDGYFVSGEKDGQGFVARTDLQGNVLWTKNYEEEAMIYDFVLSKEGGIVYTGSSQDEKVVVAKTDTVGNILWRKVYEEGLEGHRIVERPFGGYLVAGRGVHSENMLLLSMDDQGQVGPLQDLDAHPSLDINNITASAPYEGLGWEPAWLPSLFLGRGYRYKDDQVMSAAELWMMGIDESGWWQAAYEGGGDTPISLVAGYKGSGMSPFFQRAWGLTRYEIDRFKEDMADGQMDLPHSVDLLTWPARGNPYLYENGEQLVIDEELAPFYDNNKDGVYNPYDGDYPLIKGDEAFWWVMHTYTSSAGIPLGAAVQVQVMLYAFGCDSGTPLDNTSFLEYKVRNVSPSPYHDFRVGFWANFNIGCPFDDRMGTIPEYNTSFKYNATEEDSLTSICGEEYGISSYPPIQSSTLLNRDLDKCVYARRAGFFTHEVWMEEPNELGYLWRCLQGYWWLGKPFTYGGTGLNPDSVSTFPVDFVFFDEPSDPDGWSECTIEEHPEEEVPLHIVVIDTFYPEETFTLRYALVTHPDIPLPCPSLGEVKSHLQFIQDAEDAGWFELLNELWVEDTIHLQGGEMLSLPEGGTYLWGDGQTTSSIAVQESAWYSVDVTYPWGCGMQDKVYVVVDNLEPPDEHGLLVFPNPGTGAFQVYLPEAGLHDYQIFDAMGQLQGEGQLVSGQMLSLNLETGLYFLMVFLPDGVRSAQVLVFK